MTYTKYQDLALLVLRITVGVIFIHAAYVKFGMWSMQPSEAMPAGMLMLMKFLAVVELIGGLAVLLGFLTSFAALGLAIIMVGAIGMMQFMMKVGFSLPTGPGWSYPFMILGGCVVLMAFGAGSFSLEKMWKR